MKRSVLLAVLVIVFAGVDVAQGAVWKADRAHSTVQFTIAHMVVAEVAGSFRDFDATMTAARDDFSDAAIDAAIKTASINTDNEKRDAHLRGEDFLNAEKYPLITFKSTSTEKTGKDTYRFHGDLTIRDVTRPVVLEGKLNGLITDGSGNLRGGFRATTSINRFDYGVKWNKAVEAGGLVAGETVTITLLFEFIQDKASS